MLKDPVMVSRFTLKMTNDQWEVVLFDGPELTRASDPHDSSRRGSQQFPFAMSYRIKIHLPEKRFGGPCQLSERVRIDLAWHDPSCLRCRRIQDQRRLNLHALGQ